MAIKFNETSGQAKKDKVNWYKFKDGDNTFRIVGDILPMYVYWAKSLDGQNLPIECLSFDRDKERFTNEVEDVFLEYFPKNDRGEPNKPSWAYVCQALDENNNPCVVQLKKKLFTEQIQVAAEELGDPTDPDTGWAIKVKKEKTGPSNFNVSYTLKQLSLKKEPLTAEQREIVANMKSIDEIIPRPTPESQRAFIERYFVEKEDKAPEDVEEELGDLD